jgi:hypothetical protein
MTTSLPTAPSRTPDHLPTRRTVARGAAWAVPVLAVSAAAPRAAASPCPPVSYTLDWLDGSTRTYTRVSRSEAFALVLPGTGSGPSVRVDFTAATTGDLELTDLNLEISGTGVGGLSPAERGLVLSQRLTTPVGDTPPGRAARQDLLIGFSDPVSSQPLAVTDLGFTLTDIDSSTTPPNDFVDRVELGPPATSLSTGAAVTGTGTLASPLAPTADDQPLDDTTSSLGNAEVTIAGPVSAGLTVTYWNATTRALRVPDDAIQQVYLTNISFTVVSDAC